ncbi:MAG: glucose-6-phosphate dehydrogenase [Patescibacteria group bacterium]|nr:glucose-6-phosphate dehydrogenase [Patescibacteria group bacterium]MDE2437919.1 glucose-6-phosphate dehydrogenase [Patescibacteria group bacterium]
MNAKQVSIPTVLVIFGATGDLMARKIAPALFNLSQKGKLPEKLRFVGVARRELSSIDFRKHLKDALKGRVKGTSTQVHEFLDMFLYHQGLLDAREMYISLAEVLHSIDEEWGVCSNKLFYLAVPPELYKTIFEHLAASGLTIPCGGDEGWTRVLVEKPFGSDLATAEELDRVLGSLFHESQIYRIDHYLAKEMIQNILAFRFSNNLFEESWDAHHIERIDIRLFETLGVEERGMFYDHVGALVDVGQNHLLQMLALIAMDPPTSLGAESVRKARAHILESLHPMSSRDIQYATFRGQYRGYLDIKGVRPRSTTETFFKIITTLDHPRWGSVPFVLEGGKGMAEQRKEIVVTFRHPTPCLCPPLQHYKNKVIISLEPHESIVIQFWSKKPGFDFQMEERTFDFFLRDAKVRSQYVEEYEKLLLDCIAGDQTLFVSTDEVRAMWRFIDPIVAAWRGEKTVPVVSYTRGSNEAAEKSVVLEKSLLPVTLKHKEVAIVGLGKMGGNIARQLLRKGWHVTGFNRSREATDALTKEGLCGVYEAKNLFDTLHAPRIFWFMLPSRETGNIAPIDGILFGKNGIAAQLRKGDIVIDGANAFYKDSIRRYRALKKRGVGFLDVGVSGGPQGALRGASLMIGGDREVFLRAEPLFRDIAELGAYQFFEGAGAGHFVKMVHNGIEYGMMQALAEGFAIMKASKYHLDLTRVADVYNHGSVIESRLVGWLKQGFITYGEDLRSVSGTVGHTGEGAWTVETAKELKVQVKIIEGALQFRKQSAKNPSYTGKILSMIRNQFGGHSISS